MQKCQKLCDRQCQLPQVVCVDAPAAMQARHGQQLQRQRARQQVCAKLGHSVVSVQVFIKAVGAASRCKIWRLLDQGADWPEI